MKKLLTRTLAMVMTIVMLLSMAVFTASADEVLPSEDFEEENGVFHIENASDMLAFAGMAGWYEWYAGKTVSIDANIDMTGVAWTMVASFKGTLEGNGNCIKNLKIEGAGQLGIFKELNGATIKNLRILDSSVKTTDSMAGGIAVLASNATSFENVYIDSTVETSNNMRPGGFIGYTNKNASVTFKNCVSDTTCIGTRQGSGFIAQHTNENAYAEFTDCAFIGDISQGGKRGTGFVGLCDADTKFTRCISFGKNDDNLVAGDFATLNRQGGQGDNKSKHEFYDCYGVSAFDVQPAVVLDNPQGMDIFVYYGGSLLYSKECADSTTALTDNEKANFESSFKYLIKGETVKYSKDTFKIMYPVFADWTVTDVEVEYYKNKNVAVAIPTSIVTLLSGSTDVPVVDNQTPSGDANQTPDQSDNNDETETQAPETSDTKAETNAVTEDVKEDKGCGGVIGAGAIAIIAVAGAAVVATRKKED